MSSGGTSTVTQNSQPPQQFQDALTAVGQKAANDASVPFQQYPGQLLAGLSPDQQAGIQSVQNAQGIANPYINAAAQEIGASTAPLAPTIQPYANAATGLFNQAGATNLSGTVQPGVANATGLFNSSASLTPQEIQSFESPYTQQVVNSTQAEFNNQNAQQQAGISGNAISQGAFGGDREAVAHGITAGQEQLAQAPVIAGLENQGYTQAEQTALAQNQLKQSAGQGILAGSGQALSAAQAQGQLQIGAGQGITSVGGQLLGANEANAWLDSQAGFGLGNLGNEAQSTALQGANAQLSTGGLEQAQAQQALNIPYQQFTAAQAYPFQTDAWAAGIAGELANAAGGTASTTSPGPSPISQLAGLGTAGLALNQLGAFNGLGSSGATTGAIDGGAAVGGDIAATDSAFIARGGVVPHRAAGGGITAVGAMPIHIPTDTADVSIFTPAQAPNVADSVIPPDGGGIAPKKPLLGGGGKNSTTNNPNADSEFGTIAKTAGGIAAGIYGGPLGALAANALGSQVHFARGGGLASFPIHRTRMPGAGGRGLFSNDNMTAAPEPRRLAAGGVAIPQLPTGGTGITGGNGVNIPQLPTGPVARGPSGGGGGGGGLTSGSVSDYLAQQSTGASHAAPQAFVAPPKPPTAPPSLTTDQVTQLQSLLAQQQAQINQSLPSLNGDGGGMARGGGLMARRAVGGGLGDDTDMPEPPIPPGGDDGSGGLMSALSSPQPQVTPGQAPGHSPAAPGAPASSSPWQGLLMAGLGMMAGTSPHALTNIGKGGMEGLQSWQQQRAREEQQNLARLTQQETARYHSGELDLRGKQIDQTGDLTKAQMAQTLTLKQAEMAQQMALQKMQIGMEGARLAEEKAYHQQSLTPPELRIFNAYNAMSPEDQAHFSRLNLAQKGIPDITGGGGMPTMAPDAGGASPAVGAASVTPSKPPGEALPGDVQAAPTATRNDAFLSSLSPQYQPMVKALAEGRMAMPTRPSPLQQQLIAAAGQYDPTFDSTDFNKRSGTAKDFASGQSAKAVTAINTATSHLSSLSDQMQALHNGDIPMVNSISNWIKTNTGKSAPTTATETRDAVANELRKVFATTGGGGLEELKDWQSHFPINGSPAQQNDAIRQAVDLMQPRMESLAHQWNTGMGTNHAGLDLLSPSARASWQKLTGTQSPVASAPAPTYNRPTGGQTTQRPLQAPVDQTPLRVGSPAEAAKLPSGTRFLDPNGVMRTVP